MGVMVERGRSVGLRLQCLAGLSPKMEKSALPRGPPQPPTGGGLPVWAPCDPASIWVGWGQKACGKDRSGCRISGSDWVPHTNSLRGSLRVDVHFYCTRSKCKVSNGLSLHRLREQRAPIMHGRLPDFLVVHNAMPVLSIVDTPARRCRQTKPSEPSQVSEAAHTQPRRAPS